MGREIDLLINYPKTKRNVKERGASKTEEDRAIARKFEKDFFDGDENTVMEGFPINLVFGNRSFQHSKNILELPRKALYWMLDAAKGL